METVARKHDMVLYADGTLRLVRRHGQEYYLCRRCGTSFFGFELDQIAKTECPQPELPGLEDLTPE